MKALIVCENLIKYIRAKGMISGQVHSVFNNACNVETEEKFITLLTRNKIMAPMSVVLDTREEQDFKELNIKQNSKLYFSETGIYCRDNNLFIEFEKALIWFPKVSMQCLSLSEEDLLKNIKILEQGISKYVKFYGIGPLISFLSNEMPDIRLRVPQIELNDKSFQFIKYRFLDFVKGLALGDLKTIEDKAEKVIGFGVGLTPAMDDFISGIMISFIYLGSYYKLQSSQILSFNNEIISKGLNKTTKVSSEMLRLAAVGETNEAVRNLIKSILNTTVENDITKALLHTIGYGETSGSDTALGIYVGCKIMTNLKYRRVWVDEVMYRY